MVLGSHANTRAMYSTPPWPSLAASMAAYRRRSFFHNPSKKRFIFSAISAEYTSMLDSLSQNLSCDKDTTAQTCREVILDHILSAKTAALRTKAQEGMGLYLGLMLLAVVSSCVWVRCLTHSLMPLKLMVQTAN